MIELLVVVTIVALVVGLSAGVSGALNGNRGMTAVHQIAALCDSARARAMKGEGEVALAFATEAVGDAGQPYRSVLICLADDSTEVEDDFVAISEWYYLPPGFVLAQVPPLSRSAGTNLLAISGGQRRVRLPGEAGIAMLPCVGFGPLGEVVFPGPETSSDGALLIAIAEGVAESTGSQSPSGMPHRPEDCRWLGLQRSSGASLILP